MTRLKVAIVGASGYGGSELLRLLLPHPHVEVVWATSRKHAGKPLGSAHPHLSHLKNPVFTDPPMEDVARDCDAVFLALPHGEAMGRVRPFAEQNRMIFDLSSDFRLRDPSVYANAYGRVHSAPELIPSFVYGQPELMMKAGTKATRVACPGCFPTGALMALGPLAVRSLLRGRVVITSSTGSSGSGAEPGERTHHPVRAEDFRAYKPLTHQHTHEIAQGLSDLGASGIDLCFIPHSAPMVRGIATTAVVEISDPKTDVEALYRSHYAGMGFIRILKEPPRCAVVAGTQYVDIHVVQKGATVVAMSAIDNLVRGAAGQAVQCLNLAMGWPEDTGLTFMGTNP
ncbi:MAG: N-acetyl-gamma-glutamyl-phosphate reductase [Planctomycetota bacterium]